MRSSLSLSLFLSLSLSLWFVRSFLSLSLSLSLSVVCQQIGGCFDVSRPRLTAMVMSGRSVNLTTLFVGRLRPKQVLSPVAQWVKHWPSDPSVPRSIPARGEIFSTVKRGSIAQSLSLSTSHRPDMTEILLKRT